VTLEELHAPVGARGDKLQLARGEMASGDRHGQDSIPDWWKRRASLCASRR
jgi:hypothetical protein